MTIGTHVKKTYTAGFTLIELLVVISIIALLSNVVLASVRTARGRARDATRRVNLKQMQTALELYNNSNAAYPSTASAWWGDCANYGSHGETGATGFIPNLAPTYMSVLPLDPNTADPNHCYLYRSNGTNYKLMAYLLVETDVPLDPTDTMIDPARPNSAIYAVYSPGASAW